MSVQTSVTQNFAVAIEGGVQVCVRERTRQAEGVVHHTTHHWFVQRGAHHHRRTRE